MAYTQNFKALNGTIYTVLVDGVTLSTTPPLAADPFTTREDDDDDVFKPVRTQSGYLRLQSTDLATWRSLIPSGSPTLSSLSLKYQLVKSSITFRSSFSFSVSVRR